MPIPAACRGLLRRFVHSQPQLLDTSRFLRDWWEWRAPAVKVPAGFVVKGPAAMRAGVFEREEVAFVQSLKESFDVFVNVGANIGYFCLLASKMGKKVVAVEASPKNFARLTENLSLNGIADIEVFPVACGAAPAMAPIYGHGVVSSLLPGWSGANTRPVAHVPVHTLDRLAFPAVDGRRCLILIDVEGFELEVLRGADQVLRSNPSPIWMVEICLNEHQPDLRKARENFLNVFRLFSEQGYTALALENRLERVADDDLAPERLDRFADLRNFVFTRNPADLRVALESARPAFA